MSEPAPARRPRWRLTPLMSRQRVVEMVVVVFGVLIALGLDNLVQEVRFRADARDLERAFVDDLQNAAWRSLERQAVSSCLVQRLRLLSDRVDVATDELEPAYADTEAAADGYATPQIYRPVVRLWMTSSFDRAQGSEAFKRIPADRAALYASVFASIAIQRENNNAEFLAVAGLAPLAYRQTDMNSEVRADALQQLATLDRHQFLIKVISEQIVEAAFSLPEIGDDVRRPFEQKAEREAFRSDLKAAHGDCADLTVLDRLPPVAAS